MHAYVSGEEDLRAAHLAHHLHLRSHGRKQSKELKLRLRQNLREQKEEEGYENVALQGWLMPLGSIHPQFMPIPVLCHRLLMRGRVGPTAWFTFTFSASLDKSLAKVWPKSQFPDFPISQFGKIALLGCF